jgi:RepB plasmid partitioning protein
LSTAHRNAVNANIITLPSATRRAAVGQMTRFYSKTGPDCQFKAPARVGWTEAIRLRYKISLWRSPWHDKKDAWLCIEQENNSKTMKHIEKPDFKTRMKREMKSLQRNIKAAEKSYGESVFDLTVARSYIKKLLGNAKIAAYLKANHPDTFSEFKAIATAEIF